IEGSTSPERQRRAQPPSIRLTTRLESDTTSDAIQPSRQRVRLVQRGSPACEDEENRLKCVFGRVRVAEDAPALSQHHRAVTRDQRGEGGLVASLEIASQQHGVGDIDRPRGGPALYLGKNVIEGSGHDGPPRAWQVHP